MPLEPTSYAIPTNPNSALMDYRIQGPMAGLMVAEAEGQHDDALAQQRIQNNNANAMNAMTVENAQADQGNLALARQLKGTQLGNDITNAPLANEAAVSKLILSKSKDEQEQAKLRADAYVGMAQNMPDDFSPGANAKYQALLSAMPDDVKKKLPPEWSPQAQGLIKGLASQSEVIQKVLSASQLQSEKIAGEKDVAHIHGKYQVEAAQNHLRAAMQEKEAMLPQLKQIELDLKRKDKSGEPFTEDDVKQGMYVYKNQKTEQDLAPLKDRMKIDIAQMMDSSNKELKAKNAISVGLPIDATPQEIGQAMYNKQLDEQALKYVKDVYPNGMRKEPKKEEPTQLKGEVAPDGTRTNFSGPGAEKAKAIAMEFDKKAKAAGMPADAVVVGKTPDGKDVYESPSTKKRYTL